MSVLREERPFRFRPVVTIRREGLPSQVELWAVPEAKGEEPAAFEFLAASQVAHPQRYEWQWDRIVTMLKHVVMADLCLLGFRYESTDPTEYHADAGEPAVARGPDPIKQDA